MCGSQVGGPGLALDFDRFLGSIPTFDHFRPKNILSCYISSHDHLFHQLWELIMSANPGISTLIVSSIHFQIKSPTIQKKEKIQGIALRAPVLPRR